MKRAILLGLMSIGLLSACGVDGPPERPEPATAGVTISGDARIAVSTEL